MLNGPNFTFYLPLPYSNIHLTKLQYIQVYLLTSGRQWAVTKNPAWP